MRPGRCPSCAITEKVPHRPRTRSWCSCSDTTRLTGDFDGEGVGSVEHALDRLSEAPAPSRVVFDLRGLVFLGLAGLRTILEADARGRAEAFEVVVVRPRGIANRVFTLTPAGKRLSMVDEPDAV
jgi:anti-anti-sigma factor